MRYWLLILLVLVLGLSACTDPAVEVPRLMKQLRSQDPKEVSQAALSLGRIGPPHALKAERSLIALLSSPNPGVQSAAAYALRKLDTPKARSALNMARTIK